jgi:hypothetical protein
MVASRADDIDIHYQIHDPKILKAKVALPGSLSALD